MLNKDIAIDTARNFIIELKKMGYNPTSAYLFGSVINGGIHEYSDIDLALWDKKFTGAMHIDYDTLKLLLLKYKQLELHTYNTTDTEETNPFIEVIKKTGLEIPISDLKI